MVQGFLYLAVVVIKLRVDRHVGLILLVRAVLISEFRLLKGLLAHQSYYGLGGLLVFDSFGDVGVLSVFFPKLGAVLSDLLLSFFVVSEKTRIVAHYLI